MSDTIVRLYYVQHDVDDGDGDGPANWDLMVIARDEDEAIQLWRAHYWDESNVFYAADGSGQIESDGNDIQKDTMPTRVWTIPVEEMIARAPRALAWKDIKSIDY